MPAVAYESAVPDGWDEAVKKFKVIERDGEAILTGACPPLQRDHGKESQ